MISKKEQAAGKRERMNTKNKKWERMRRLVKVLGTTEMSRKELIEALGLRQESRRNFYYNYTHPANEEGILHMFIPSTPNSPAQTYKLTAKGLELLEMVKKEETDSKKEQAAGELE